MHRVPETDINICHIRFLDECASTSAAFSWLSLFSAANAEMETRANSLPLSRHCRPIRLTVRVVAN